MRNPLKIVLALLLLPIIAALIWILSAILAPIEKPTLANRTPAIPEEIDADRYKVYSATLEQSYLDKDISLPVIQDTTSSEGVFRGFQTNDYQVLLMADELLSFASRETIKDFCSKNNRPSNSSPLTERFSLPVRYKLIAPEMIKKYFEKGQNMWERFYQDYPKSSGIITLSNVGFNESLSEALVYIEHRCGSLCGSGKYIVLVKSNGKWEVKHEYQRWVS